MVRRRTDIARTMSLISNCLHILLKHLRYTQSRRPLPASMQFCEKQDALPTMSDRIRSQICKTLPSRAGRWSLCATISYSHTV